jgi:hypothetical protein
MLIDTRHWDGLCDWVMSIVRGIDFSRRTVQWLGILVPLFILASLRWRGFPKGMVILSIVLLVLVGIFRTLAYAVTSVGHSIATSLHEAGERDAALHPPGSLPNLRLDPRVFNKLNPFNDIPAPPTIVKFNVPNDATNNGGNATDPNNTDNQQH